MLHSLCKRFGQFLIAALLLLVCAGALRAQVDTASIVGIVKDPSGAAVSGARVTVTNDATGEQSTVSSGDGGNYIFPYLRVGTYTVSVEAAGFKKAVVSDIKLDVQDRKQVDVSLELGTATQTTTVTAITPLLDTQTADVGHVTDSQQVQDLPLNGRRYDQLSLLTAGVNEPTPSFQGRAEGVFSINGNSSTQNNFVLDGGDNNSYTTNLQDQSAQSVQPPVDSLAEFKIQTRDYNVEYGRSAGGVINASVKSGTNGFHGDAYEFLRNDHLDANDFFLNAAQQPRAIYQQNQFGGTLGGPIRKNKTFFFLGYEGTRINQGNTLVGTVPTPLMREGNFTELASPPTSPSIAGLGPFAGCINGGIVKSTCIDPVAAKIFALYPLPNTNLAEEGVPGAFTGNNYITSAKSIRNSDAGVARIDQRFGDSDSVYGHLVIFDLRRNLPGIFSAIDPIADGTLGSTDGINLDRGTSITLAWIHTFSPALFNDAHFTFNRAASHSEPDALGNYVAPQFGLTGIPNFGPATSGGLPEIDISGFQQLGSPRWLPQSQFAQVWQIKDAVTYVKGTHALKAGFEWRRDADNFTDLCCTRGFYNFSGQYTGQGLTDFLLGLPANQELENLDVAHIYRDGVSWFVGDTWRTTSRLTINYGLRYEYTSPLYERDNHVTNFLPSTGALYTVPSNASGAYGRTTVHPVYDNFAPRVGLAYQITPKLVWRAGAGIYYSSYYRYGSESQTALNPPFLTDHAVNNSPTQAPPLLLQNGFPANFLNPVAITDIAAVSQLQLRTVDPNLKPSTTYEYSFGFQYALFNDWMIEAAYVGNQSRHLWDLSNLNQGNLINPGSPPVFPYPEYVVNGLPTFIENLESASNANYNALQITVDKKISNGLLIHAGYVHSKAMSQVSDFEAGLRGNPQNRYDRTNEWALWDNDTPDRFVASITYILPVGPGQRYNPEGVAGKIVGGWQVNSIITYSAGQPIVVGIPFDLSGTGTGSRPNCLPVSGGFNRTINDWLNAAQFAQPAPYYFGTCSATPGPRAPGIKNWDFSLFKRFPVTETKSIEFRAEFFNIWNTPQFSSPSNTTINTVGFGQITSLALSPRQIQFALKFYF
jgi:hypothetical protein